MKNSNDAAATAPLVAGTVLDQQARLERLSVQMGKHRSQERYDKLVESRQQHRRIQQEFLSPLPRRQCRQRVRAVPLVQQDQEPAEGGVEFGRQARLHHPRMPGWASNFVFH